MRKVTFLSVLTLFCCCSFSNSSALEFDGAPFLSGFTRGRVVSSDVLVMCGKEFTLATDPRTSRIVLKEDKNSSMLTKKDLRSFLDESDDDVKETIGVLPGNEKAKRCLFAPLLAIFKKCLK